MVDILKNAFANIAKNRNKEASTIWYPIVDVNCNQKFADLYYAALKESLINYKSKKDKK